MDNTGNSRPDPVRLLAEAIDVPRTQAELYLALAMDAAWQVETLERLWWME